MITQEKILLLQQNAIWVDPNEKILWIGQPNKYSYVLNEFWELLKGLGLMIGVIAFFVLIGSIYKKEILWTETGIFFAIVLCQIIYKLTKRLVELKSTIYLLTDSRAVIYKRFAESEITSLDLKGIISKEIRKTFIDRKYNTATLAFHSGIVEETDNETTKVYDYFYSIENANDVFNMM